MSAILPLTCFRTHKLIPATSIPGQLRVVGRRLIGKPPGLGPVCSGYDGSAGANLVIFGPTCARDTGASGEGRCNWLAQPSSKPYCAFEAASPLTWSLEKCPKHAFPQACLRHGGEGAAIDPGAAPIPPRRMQ